MIRFFLEELYHERKEAEPLIPLPWDNVNPATKAFLLTWLFFAVKKHCVPLAAKKSLRIKLT